jgi:hypothetical protein
MSIKSAVQKRLHDFAADTAFQVTNNPGKNYNKMYDICKYIEGKTDKKPVFRSQSKADKVEIARKQYQQAAILLG